MTRSAAAVLALLATPALAHPGDHSGLSLLGSLAHIALEPDHLIFAAATVAVGVLAYRAGKRAGAKGRAP
jgi:hypothetical protein